MRIRAALALVMMAGVASPAAAQGLFRLTYTWQEVQGSTTNPVTAPNSVVDIGEAARITLNVQALLNGADPVGQTVSYTPPPPPGVATVRGISHFWYDLRGDGGAASAAGTWGPVSNTAALGSNSEGPFVFQDGALLSGLGAGQFVAPGGTAVGLNPIPNAFRGVWRPASYSSRTVHFAFESFLGSPAGQNSGFTAAYGITRPNPNDPTTWYDNLITVYYPNTDFGSGLNIPIAPAPSAAALLAMSMCAVCRRNRNSMTEARR